MLVSFSRAKMSASLQVWSDDDDNEEVERYHTPAVPGSHPIIYERLDKWLDAALLANGPGEARNIRHFYKNLRHISFDKFKRALGECFDALSRQFPPDKYKVELTNESIYSDREKGNSVPWLGDLVVSLGLYDTTPAVKRRHKNRWLLSDGRLWLRTFVDDAAYSGQTLAAELSHTYAPQVCIVPYIASRDAILHHARTNDTLCFLNAQTGVMTKRPDRGDQFEPVSMNGFSFEGYKVIVYVEELVDIPFYFDHKLADYDSWRTYLWMFRGFHSKLYGGAAKGEGPPPARTNFISGCDGDDDAAMLSDHYYCPIPPYKSNNRAP